MHEPIWLWWTDYPRHCTNYECRRCGRQYYVNDDFVVSVDFNYDWERHLREMHDRDVEKSQK